MFCCQHRKTDKVEFKWCKTENGSFAVLSGVSWDKGKWKLANNKFAKGNTSLIVKVYRNGLLIGTTNEKEALAVGSLQSTLDAELLPGQLLCDFKVHGDEPKKMDAGSVELEEGVYLLQGASSGDLTGGPADRMEDKSLFGKDMRGRPFLAVEESEHVLLKLPEMPLDDVMTPVQDNGHDDDDVNDQGHKIKLGTERKDKYYCGQDVGESNLPGSDGHCGPNNGPQCQSCLRFQSSPGNVTKGTNDGDGFTITECGEEQFVGTYVKQASENDENDGRPWYQHESNDCRAFYIESMEKWYLNDDDDFESAIFQTYVGTKHSSALLPLK